MTLAEVTCDACNGPMTLEASTIEHESTWACSQDCSQALQAAGRDGCDGFGWRDRPGGDQLWKAILEAFAQ